MAARDPRMRYLVKLDGRFYVRVAVPRKLRAAVGNTHIRKALHTSSLEEAERLKFAMVAAIKRQLSKVTTVGGKLDQDAAEIRREIQAARAAGDQEAADVYEDLVDTRAERLAEQLGLQQAKRFATLATASTEPLSVLALPWLSDKTVTPGTQLARSRALNVLLGYMGGDCLPAGVTDDTSLDLAEHLRKTVAPRTARSTYTRLSSLWKYLQQTRGVRRGTNPFAGHTFRMDPTADRKRAFTEPELLKMLGALLEPPYHAKDGPARRALVDLVVLLLSSGCRAEEVAGATDVQVRDGAAWVRVQSRKGNRLMRVVPICHPTALTVLQRRPSIGPLFPDLPPKGVDQKRHVTAGKNFGQLKTRLGLPRSVDMHGCRRYVITTLEQAGASPIDIARFCGQSVAASLALSTYSAGASEAQMVATARLIRFSPPVEAALWRLVEAAG